MEFGCAFKAIKQLKEIKMFAVAVTIENSKYNNPYITELSVLAMIMKSFSLNQHNIKFQIYTSNQSVI